MFISRFQRMSENGLERKGTAILVERQSGSNPPFKKWIRTRQHFAKERKKKIALCESDRQVSQSSYGCFHEACERRICGAAAQQTVSF